MSPVLDTRLVDLLKNSIGPEPAGRTTREELDQVLDAVDEVQLELFAARAIDTFADSELVALLADRIGKEHIPEQLDRLSTNSTSQPWYHGHVVIEAGTRGFNPVVQVLQRALMKIGAHHPHPDAPKIVEKMQQWGADGYLGAGTLAGLKIALQIAQRNDLADEVGPDADLGKPMAEAINELLKSTPIIVHPVTIRPPPRNTPRVVMHLGMGEWAKHELYAIQKHYRWDSNVRVEGIRDSMVGDDQVRVGNQIFELTEEDRQMVFLDTAFHPPLSDQQKEAIFAAFKGRGYGIKDSLDEIASLAMFFHRMENTRHPQMIDLIFSGHSSGGGWWGDDNGHFPLQAIEQIAGAFPLAAKQVYSFNAQSCNHLKERHVQLFGRLFPNLEVEGLGIMGGYKAYGPGTWTGGRGHTTAWLQLLDEARERGEGYRFTAADWAQRCFELHSDAGTNNDHVGFASKRKTGNMAVFSDGKYYTLEKDPESTYDQSYAKRGADGAPVQHERVIETSAQRIERAIEKLNELKPDFENLLRGVRPPDYDLTEVDPRSYETAAMKYYNAAVDLEGLPGLNEQQIEFASREKDRGICARFYNRIREKFVETFRPQIVEVNQELDLGGRPLIVPDQLAADNFTRKEMLDLIDRFGQDVAALEEEGTRVVASKELLKNMRNFLRDFAEVPSNWL